MFKVLRTFLLLLCTCLIGFGCSGLEKPYYPVYRGMFWQLPLISEGTTKRISGVNGIDPGQAITLADIKGAGVIHHFWLTLKHDSQYSFQELVLRAWWDNEPEPSIEVPLGDFFAVGFAKERHLKSLPIEMTPAGGDMHSALNCYLPMPFNNRALIEVENQGQKPVELFIWQINYEQLKKIGGEVGRLHAQWRRENPVTRGLPYTILEAEGEGVYVGTVLNVHVLGPGGWVEGGDDFYIDGDTEPTLAGIGGEDYFGQSWGYKVEYNNLFHGTSFGPTQDDIRMTAYRFHLPDPIRFKKSLRVTMRCHGWDVQDRSDDYSSVAYWYQLEPHSPFPELAPLSERLP